jgi:hypothetical protein
MSLDAAGFNYISGHPGVVTPNDPIETIQQVAAAYKIEWLVIERDNAVTALGPVLSGQGRPGWIGPPVYTIAEPGDLPRAALYPVCLSPVDARCAVVAAVEQR